MWWCVGVVVFALIGGFNGFIIGFGVAINLWVVFHNDISYRFIKSELNSKYYAKDIKDARDIILCSTIAIWFLVWCLL